MTIKEMLENMHLKRYVRILVKTKFHGKSVPLGGGYEELIIKKYGDLEVLATSVTENRNVCFYVPFKGEYLV